MLEPKLDDRGVCTVMGVLKLERDEKDFYIGGEEGNGSREQ